MCMCLNRRNERKPVTILCASEVQKVIYSVLFSVLIFFFFFYAAQTHLTWKHLRENDRTLFHQKLFSFFSFEIGVVPVISSRRLSQRVTFRKSSPLFPLLSFSLSFWFFSVICAERRPNRLLWHLCCFSASCHFLEKWGRAVQPFVLLSLVLFAPVLGAAGFGEPGVSLGRCQDPVWNTLQLRFNTWQQLERERERKRKTEQI